MREILFHGKRIDNGEWVEGFLVKHPSAVHIGDYSPWFISVPPKDPDDCGGLYNIIPETVGQFTGLTDKNGRKVFEGDLLKEPDITHNGEIQIPGHVLTVSMRKGCWCVITPNDIDGWDFLTSNAKLCEVIGNIHDNPELLEVYDAK